MAGARHPVDHRHIDLEFDLVIKGAGSFMLDDHHYELKPGTLIWLVPGQQHRLVRTPGLEMWVATLRPELIDAERITQLAQQPLRQLPSHELIDLDRLLSQIAQDSDEPTVYNAGIAYLVMRAWRASLESPAARARPMHAAVTRALLLLRESGATMSLSELASAAGVAAPYLSRLLIEHSGHSFVDWRNHIRIERFMQGYRPGANLLDTALAAGFGSYARFNHIFNETIGCAPSEWIKQAERGDAPRPAGNYGVPATPTLSTRQSWTAVVPLVAPSVSALFGRDFIARLLATPADAGEATPQRYEPLDTALPQAASDRLITALREHDSAGADMLAHLMELHDFSSTYLRLCDAFGLAPGRLADAVTAYVLVILVAANRASDPSATEVRAAARQIETTLVSVLMRLKPDVAQDTHTALICHFVVTYRAVEAARASGDPREFDQLRDAAIRCGHAAFDGDVSQIALGSRGFVRRIATRSGAKASPARKK